MANWFTKWFEKPLNPIGFNCLQVDMHSHFIPGIDDGAATMEDSINMIKAMRDLGFKKLVTTPHVMSDFYKNTPEIILDGLQKVQAELTIQNIDVALEAAAEYYVDFDFEEKMNAGKLLTFGDDFLLVETSFIEAPQNFKEIIFRLQVAGYKVVLAHPERYPFMSMEDYEDLKERSVYLQLNLLSLIGHYGPAVREKAIQLVHAGLVRFVGTDCHHMGHAALYEKCQTERAWHQLVESGQLLNHSL